MLLLLLLQVECCTPAILLSSGEVWQLKRCDCALSATKDCGGTQSMRLLWGFAQWRWVRGRQQGDTAASWWKRGWLGWRLGLQPEAGGAGAGEGGGCQTTGMGLPVRARNVELLKYRQCASRDVVWM